MRVRFAVVLAATSLLGCSRGNSSDDWSGRAEAPGVAQPQASAAPGASIGAPAEPVSPAAPPVRNAHDVKRYGDESPLGSAGATLVKSAVAHDAMDKGIDERGVVTLLLGGTPVSEVAERDGWVLVGFDEPSGQARELGWIPMSAIEPATRACPPTQTTFRSAQGSFCAKPCRDSRACGPDAVCVQSGAPVEQGGRITNLVMYCVPR